MVFTSNRPGGFGGYDLYYSVFKNGKWSSPVNFGPRINTASDEYRPLIGYHPDFTNIYMIFSSDRPEEKEDLISISQVLNFLQNNYAISISGIISSFCSNSVLRKSDTLVIGPTPPGTGVIYEHFGATFSKSTSPASLNPDLVSVLSILVVPTSMTTAPIFYHISSNKSRRSDCCNYYISLTDNSLNIFCPAVDNSDSCIHSFL